MYTPLHHLFSATATATAAATAPAAAASTIHSFTISLLSSGFSLSWALDSQSAVEEVCCGPTQRMLKPWGTQVDEEHLLGA